MPKKLLDWNSYPINIAFKNEDKIVWEREKFERIFLSRTLPQQIPKEFLWTEEKLYTVEIRICKKEQRAPERENMWINIWMAFTTYIPHCTGSLTYCSKARKRNETQRLKRKRKLSLFKDDITVCA